MKASIISVFLHWYQTELFCHSTSALTSSLLTLSVNWLQYCCFLGFQFVLETNLCLYWHVRHAISLTITFTIQPNFTLLQKQVSQYYKKKKKTTDVFRIPILCSWLSTILLSLYQHLPDEFIAWHLLGRSYFEVKYT